MLTVAWKVTDDIKYADRAVILLDSWSGAMKTLYLDGVAQGVAPHQPGRTMQN